LVFKRYFFSDQRFLPLIEMGKEIISVGGLEGVTRRELVLLLFEYHLVFCLWEYFGCNVHGGVFYCLWLFILGYSLICLSGESGKDGRKDSKRSAAFLKVRLRHALKRGES